MNKASKFFLGLICFGFILTSQAQIFNIVDFGAVGDSTTLCTSAIQAAVDSCHNSGGGTVEVPAGVFLTATVFLKSNVTLHISAGGTIKGSDNTALYPDVNPSIRNYTDNYPQKSVFYAEGQHNIAITGEGTFHGNGQSLVHLLNMDARPYGFRFFSCSNIRYENVTLRHSAFWMMHNFNIDTLVVKNVTIINQAFGNNDGVNIDCCKNVLVDSVYADCNDDPMVLKTTCLLPCENVEIKNCTVGTYSRALKMGTETHGVYRNIHVHDCKVQYSLAGPFGTNSPASCGINLSAVDGGGMENVLFDNISMEGIETPILIRLGNRARKYTDTAATPGIGFIRNVELRNITATATTNLSSTITGIPGYDAKNIRLKNIDITYPGGWPDVGVNRLVPENETGRPETDIFGDTLPAGGFYLRHLDSVSLENVCFHTLQPDGRPEIAHYFVSNLDTSTICGTLYNNIPNAENVFGSIYPNPVTADQLVVELNRPANGSKLFIGDINGRELWSGDITSIKPVVNVDALPAGLYFLRIVGKGTSSVSRFIKQ